MNDIEFEDVVHRDDKSFYTGGVDETVLDLTTDTIYRKEPDPEKIAVVKFCETFLKDRG